MDLKIPSRFKDKMPGKPSKNNKILKIGQIVLIIVAVLAGFYLTLHYTGYLKALGMAREIQKQQQQSADDQKILDQLKKIIQLPEDVQPVMGIVSDVEALKKQDPDFFSNAKNGDRVIVYPNYAVLYDAGANKIMNIGQMKLAAAKVPVAVYNGTNNAQKLNDFEAKLAAVYPNVEVTVRQNANSNEYQQTLVIDLTGKNRDIDKVAESLGGVASALPSGEIAPEGVAVLIIVGDK